MSLRCVDCNAAIGDLGRHVVAVPTRVLCIKADCTQDEATDMLRHLLYEEGTQSTLTNNALYYSRTLGRIAQAPHNNALRCVVCSLGTALDRVAAEQLPKSEESR